MNIPLDNLYHWIQGLAQRPVMLYVFRPHGSKDIFDLDVLETDDHNPMLITAICHDQEPLNFSHYEFDHDLDRLNQLMMKRDLTSDEIKLELPVYSNLSLFSKFKPNWLNVATTLSDWFILIHSEKNSIDVELFTKHGFRPVYYWSHAVIARDWYRFAQYDRRLDQRHPKKTFLIYCRDWTPNREYRLKFLDLLFKAKMIDDCVITIQHINNQGIHLQDYQVQDTRFCVNTVDLLSIPNNVLPASVSADYDADDIIETAVSVVLETEVDGSKIHLTEKILRPIACAHPFIIMAGPGALAYLRSYGFHTFGEFWNESYDLENDISKRMEMVIQTMHDIQQLSPQDWQEINQIAQHNKQHFFSEAFLNQVTSELQTNLNNAIDFCHQNQGETYWQWRKLIRRLGLGNKYSCFKDSRAKIAIHQLRQHRLRRFQNKPVPICGQ